MRENIFLTTFDDGDMNVEATVASPIGENCANLDVLIVGAGFAECTCCTNVGAWFSTRVFEVGKGVEAWYWNDTRVLVVMSKVCNTLINSTLN